jgi:hypothetical protein
MTLIPGTAEAAVLEVDTNFERFITEGNVDALDDILADDFRYTHVADLIEDRATWLQVARDRPVAERRRRVISEVEADVHRDFALTKGNLDIIRPDGTTLFFRYVRAYRLTDEGWKLASHFTMRAVDRQEAHL